MNQVIQLEPQDDIATIRAKLENAELARVVMVVPPDCAALQNEAGLQLVRRAADDLGTQIALVAHNSFVRTRAGNFGFPVFSSLPQAQRARWQMREPLRADKTREAKPPADAPESSQRFVITPATIKEWRGAILIIASAMLVLCVAAFFLVPTAQVRLVPSPIAPTVSADVIVDSSITQVNPNTRSVPARRINKEMIGTLQLATTTTKTVPNARSAGTVTFTNLREEETTIPPGTIVKTSAGVPVRFSVVTTATVPAGVGSRAEASIQAIDAGTGSNVRELAINIVEGSLALSVRVINTKPTVSGSLRSVKVVTADDKTKLKEQLTSKLKQQALTTLNGELKTGEMIVPGSILVDLEDEQYDRTVDEPADVLNLKVSANAFGLAVEQSDWDALARAILQTQLQTGYQMLPNATQVEFLPGANFRGIQLSQPIRATGYATQQIDAGKVAAAVAGKSIGDAKTILSTRLSLARTPDIRVSPPLWFWMPWFTFRIAVFVDSPTVQR